MFDHVQFIFNPKLGVDLRRQLLSKYKVKFDNFGLFGIEIFGYHFVSQFEDLHRSIHFGIFLIFDFQ